MYPIRLFFILLFFIVANQSFAQPDSTIESITALPKKYFTTIDKKIDVYNSRITNKTAATLKKLSRWEQKIQSLLQKVSPETAEKLFGKNQVTFTSLNNQLNRGEAILLSYEAQYDKYRDDLTTSLKYLETQKEYLDSGIVKKARVTKKSMEELNTKEDQVLALKEFIKERKKKLIEQSIKFIGKSKYLYKINKEAYYYAASLKNYKEHFADSKKTEELVKTILEKIPTFHDFLGHNSQLSDVFSPSSLFSDLSSANSIPVVNGIPSRVALQSFMVSTFPMLTTNPIQQMQIPSVKEKIDLLQNKLNELQDLEQKEIPDFKPNSQHIKSFKERLEYGFDCQFKKDDTYHPTNASTSVTIGYKINDKSSAGIGVNYVIGLGKGWKNLNISSEGIGLRTYVKWKLKKGFDIQGGGEWNHLKFTNISQLKIDKEWQKVALIGFGKNYSITKKVKGNFHLLYDILHRKHFPVSDPFIIRVGYEF